MRGARDQPRLACPGMMLDGVSARVRQLPVEPLYHYLHALAAPQSRRAIDADLQHFPAPRGKVGAASISPSDEEVHEWAQVLHCDAVSVHGRDHGEGRE